MINDRGGSSRRELQDIAWLQQPEVVEAVGFVSEIHATLSDDDDSQAIRTELEELHIPFVEIRESPDARWRVYGIRAPSIEIASGDMYETLEGREQIEVLFLRSLRRAVEAAKQRQVPSSNGKARSR